MKFTIDRRTWLRGQGSMNSALLTAKGCMCCLGFRAIASGLSRDQILGCSDPASVYEQKRVGSGIMAIDGALVVRKFNGNVDMGVCVSSSCHLIISVNDGPSISDSTREHSLTSLFETIGDEVEFVG